MGLEPLPATPLRLAGALLLVGGVVVMRLLGSRTTGGALVISAQEGSPVATLRCLNSAPGQSGFIMRGRSRSSADASSRDAASNQFQLFREARECPP